jgi:hypothetical protein
MKLPIDARQAPFKSKYIDEETPMFARWFIFGQDAKDGTCFLHDGQDDVVKGLTFTQAQALVAARKLFIDTSLRILNGTGV